MPASEELEAREPCPDAAELWDFEDAAASERRFRSRALEERARGRDDCRDQAMTQVARALGLQRKFAEGHQILDDLAEAGEPSGRIRVYALLERGRLFNSAEQVAQAKPFFEQAFEDASGAGFDDLAVDAAHMVAIALIGEPGRALVWNERALELAEQSVDPRARRWQGSLHNNIGWTKFDLERFEEALEHFVRLEELRRADGNTAQALIARWSQGKTLRKMGQVSAALELQEELLSKYEASGLEPSGYLYEELGECKLELGVDGHRPAFRRAFELLSLDPWLAEHEAERLERLERLAR